MLVFPITWGKERKEPTVLSRSCAFPLAVIGDEPGKRWQLHFVSALWIDFWWILQLHKNNCCMEMYLQIHGKLSGCEFSKCWNDQSILDNIRIENLPEVGPGLSATVCVSLWKLKLQLKKYWQWGHYMFLIPPLPPTGKIYFFAMQIFIPISLLISLSSW